MPAMDTLLVTPRRHPDIATTTAPSHQVAKEGACEHPFRLIEQLWDLQKTRYGGIAKNLARAQTMFALANLYAVRHRLVTT